MISYSVRKSNDIFAFKEKYLPFSSSFSLFHSTFVRSTEHSRTHLSNNDNLHINLKAQRDDEEDNLAFVRMSDAGHGPGSEGDNCCDTVAAISGSTERCRGL